MEMGKDKLKRFADIKTFENVIHPLLEYQDQSHQLKGNWHKEFNSKKPIILELGCGRGEYTVALAQRFKEKNFIGIDIKGARLWRGAKTAHENSMKNIRFMRTKVDFIDKLFSNDEVEEIWLTFSDPQPKKPRKRLTSPLFIDRYKKILNLKGIIHLKTDSDLLYNYTLDEINDNNFTIVNKIDNIYDQFESLDLEIQNTLEIKTFYEKKWLKEGKSIKYVSFKINS
jgi:tRNA (guanine-N7-)-methyltransferase